LSAADFRAILGSRSDPARLPLGSTHELPVLALYDGLVGIAVPPDKANAVIDALERDMGATLATKTDILLLRQEIDHLRQKVEGDLELLRASMTVRLGSIQVVTAGLLFAALKLT
jgi:hypothetical protein